MADKVVRPERHVSISNDCTPLEVIEALGLAHSSLEVLGIDLGGRWPVPGWARIPSLKQFVALKVLYINLTCVWDRHAMNNKDLPPGPDMLFTTLLPESIQEIALFDSSSSQAFKFKVESHVMRLALDVKEKGRFQQLKLVRGQGFWPFGCDLPPELGSAENDDILARVSALNDAKTLLGDKGVGIIFDIKAGSDLRFDNIVSFY